MRLCFLGTASGTEPMPDRRHSSTVLEVGGDLYWLDAGEACAVTAHLLGLDLLKTKKNPRGASCLPRRLWRGSAQIIKIKGVFL